MLRGLLVAIGLVDLLAPRTFIAAAEGIALENPAECNLKPWVYPVARAEGLLFLGLAWRGDTAISRFKQFLGVVGVLTVLNPRLFIDSAARIAYTDPDRCHWKPWCYPLARVIGVVYVLVAANERRTS